MKNVVLKYGLLSAAVMIAVFLIQWLFFADLDFGTSEILGYISMIVSLSFVYFGLRYYRDNVNNNVLSFGQGLKIGVLIILIPSLAFGLLDILYVTVINPDFLDDYYTQIVADMKEKLPPSEFEVKLASMESEKEMFSNPVIQFVVMGITVFLVGFIMTIISTLLLQRKEAN